MTIGQRLKILRAEKSLPQKTVAAELTISVSTLSNYENDRHQPDVHTLSRLAVLYNVSVDYLVGLSKTPYSANTFDTLNEHGIPVPILLEALSKADPHELELLLTYCDLVIEHQKNIVTQSGKKPKKK